MGSTPQRRNGGFAPKALIKLLDSRSIEVVLHPRLSVGDVLALVTDKSDISQHDSRFFGLSFVDNMGYFHWLDPSLILCDLVDLSRQGYLYLAHNVRFFVDTIYEVQSASTAKLYFLEVHNQIARHELNVFENDYVEIVSLMLSIYSPDLPEEAAREVLSMLLPNGHPSHVLLLTSSEEIERRIVDDYLGLKGSSPGNNIISLLKRAEKSETYGYRFHEVTDDAGQKCLLSIGSKGIFTYERDNIARPVYTFPWRLLDNLYYRETKFSIEMREPKRNFADEAVDEMHDEQLSQAFSHPTTQVSTSRRRTTNRVLIYNFRCDSPLLCRTIWSSCIAQHQFFLEQKALHKKGRSKGVVDHRELTEKLNRLTSNSSIGSSLPSLSSLHSSSSGTMPSAKIADGSSCTSLPSMNGKPVNNMNNSVSTSTFASHKSEEEISRDRARYTVLIKKKEELHARLAEKMRELRQVCIQEGELVGEMPKEIQETLLPGEELPRLKRRVGTAFSIPEELIKADKADKMSQLETDVELHRRIVAAASRLATDKSTNKSVRKKRQKDLVAARQKLNRLEIGLQQMRHSASKPDISSIASDASANSWSQGGLTTAVTKSCPTTPRGSVPDLTVQTDGEGDDERERVPRRAPSALSRYSAPQQRYSATSSNSTSSSDSLGLGLPPRPTSRKSLSAHPVDPLDNPLGDPANPIYENVGYRSTSYRSSYRQAHYPTIQVRHDEHSQQQRKRAQSAHSIALEQSSAGRVACSYSIPMQDATQKFLHQEEDGDVTPSAEAPPIRRLPTSVSCQAGFATASLDRRQARPTVRNIAASTTLNESARASPPMHMVTTFPVAHPTSTHIIAGKPYSTSELPRFQPPPSRLGPLHSRGSLPQYSASLSHGKLPANTNPQMEALLHYYKQQQSPQKRALTQPPPHPQHKTATIV